MESGCGSGKHRHNTTRHPESGGGEIWHTVDCMRTSQNVAAAANQPASQPAMTSIARTHFEGSQVFGTSIVCCIALNVQKVRSFALAFIALDRYELRIGGRKERGEQTVDVATPFSLSHTYLPSLLS